MSPPPALRDAQAKSPFSACGRSVAFLMRAPVFAALPFGMMTRLVVGQVNRGHYFFILDAADEVQGYCGWAQVSHGAAEAWLTANRDIADPGAKEGPVCAINLWHATGPAVNAAMIAALRRRLSRATEAIVARRFYADGRVRPVRLRVDPGQLRD